MLFWNDIAYWQTFWQKPLKENQEDHCVIKVRVFKTVDVIQTLFLSSFANSQHQTNQTENTQMWTSARILTAREFVYIPKPAW